MNSIIRKTGVFVVAILMGIMICYVTATAGSVLYSTLGPNNEYPGGSGGYFVDGSNCANQVLANQFTLSAGANVADAVLALGNYAGGNNPVNV